MLNSTTEHHRKTIMLTPASKVTANIVREIQGHIIATVVSFIVLKCCITEKFPILLTHI